MANGSSRTLGAILSNGVYVVNSEGGSGWGGGRQQQAGSRQRVAGVWTAKLAKARSGSGGSRAKIAKGGVNG